MALYYSSAIFCDLGQITLNGIHFLWVQFPRSCACTLRLGQIALSVVDERAQAPAEVNY